MKDMLNACRGCPVVTYEAGRNIIVEKQKTGNLYVLLKGTLEVYRDDISIAFIDEPGAVIGEMSLLLDIPHTANVRALEPSDVHVIEDGIAYLAQHPEALLPIASLLAERLQGATTYLVDLKQQFQDQANHFGMVDQVLESLTHQPKTPTSSGGLPGGQ